MRSKWIEYNGKKIFYQDFSGHFYNWQAVKEELDAVQAIVIQKPKDSVLVLADFRDTAIAGDLMSALNASSSLTKDHVHKTAVLGVTGIKRRLGDMLSMLTGQPLKYFDDETAAKNWLVAEE
ncbi:MAG: STAS/SEC14 domain-containing protein [Chloroflexi bacterium]|nr:STAS/SEC14 domain-containing protein [Chloroflexota bacterium]